MHIVEQILGENVERLSPRDARMLFDEHDGHKIHHLPSYFFDATGSPYPEVDQARAIEWMAERLTYAPFFNRRIRGEVFDLDYPYWAPEEVKLHNHVFVHTVEERGWPPVAAILGQLVSTRMDLSRPPWELHVLTGIRGVHDLTDEVVGVVLKVHHCAIDGMALREVVANLYSDETTPGPGGGNGPVPRRLRTVGRLGMAGRAALSLPANLLRFARGTRATVDVAGRIAAKEADGTLVQLRKYPSTALNGTVEGTVGVDFVTIAMADVGAIRAAVPGATVNDVVLAAVSGALRKSVGASPGPLAAKVPRSVRSVEQWSSANQLVLLSIPLYNEVDDPLARLRQIVQSSRAAKERSNDEDVRRLSSRIETSPALLTRIAAWGQRAVRKSPGAVRPNNTMVTNVPLETDSHVFCGARGVAVIACMPPIDGDLLRHAVTWKDRETLVLTVCADESAIADVPGYCALIRGAVAELLASTGDGS